MGDLCLGYRFFCFFTDIFYACSKGFETHCNKVLYSWFATNKNTFYFVLKVIYENALKSLVSSLGNINTKC